MTRGAVAQSVLVVVGAWLMVAPAVLGHAGETIGKSDRVVGPAVLAIAFLGVFPITRLVRWANLLPGAWLLAAPFVLGAPTDATVSDVLGGLVVLALAPVERADQSRYGGGWDTLVKPERLPE
jgi:hypothetical protein